MGYSPPTIATTVVVQTRSSTDGSCDEFSSSYLLCGRYGVKFGEEDSSQMCTQYTGSIRDTYRSDARTSTYNFRLKSVVTDGTSTQHDRCLFLCTTNRFGGRPRYLIGGVINTSYQKLPVGSGDYPDKFLFQVS